ncbi:cytochrome P450 [Streptomyces hygroscopicus]|uniref:cytochrome P450 n=1 Tax=Streptomyces hygroscopicus TaxID=1912 RepID=UPI000AC500F3|nr:cytochrome P450 [Streptomyces hygroscopicus]GLV77038.1 cytochrome P450 [Streptomyces hygroscopicus subsp. hygroscopicus]
MTQPEPLPSAAATPAPAEPPSRPSLPGLPDLPDSHVDAVELSGPRFQTEPAQVYRELRQRHGPVAPVLLHGGVPAWLVLGYREVLQVTQDAALFSRDSSLWRLWSAIPEDWPLRPLIGEKQESILFTVGEVHRKRADAVNEALFGIDPFALRDRSERIADTLIDGFCERGSSDLIAEYARQLPALVLAYFFGFSDSEADEVTHSINDMMDGAETAVESQAAFYTACRELVAAKREHPGADATSRLIACSPTGSEEEIVQDLMVMFAAAHQPTAEWIGNTLRLMLTDERFALSLSGGRRSVGWAMNEVLWEDTPSQNVAGRWPTRDTVLGGQRLHAGDLLVLGFAAANTDPQVRPDPAVSTQGNSAFLSFGHGEHGCPMTGRESAETIARAGIEALLDRLPDVDLAVPAQDLLWRPSPWMRGLSALPVRFTPGPRTLG